MLFVHIHVCTICYKYVLHCIIYIYIYIYICMYSLLCLYYRNIYNILETFTGAFYIKIMLFAGFLRVQIHSWNGFGSGLQGSWNVGILRMDLDMEKIRETHNLYRNIYNFYLLRKHSLGLCRTRVTGRKLIATANRKHPFKNWRIKLTVATNLRSVTRILRAM